MMAAKPPPHRAQGDRLKQARQLLRLTQQELADQIGASLPTVKGYERGVRIPNRDFCRALAAVGVNVAYVLDGVGDPLLPQTVSRQKASQAVAAALGDKAARKERAVEIDGYLGRIAKSADWLRLVCDQHAIQLDDSWGGEFVRMLATGEIQREAVESILTMAVLAPRLIKESSS